MPYLLQASMGYTPGEGIGKHGTGIAEPISEPSNKGRHGLGFLIEGLEAEDVKWETEKVCVDIFHHVDSIYIII